MELIKVYTKTEAGIVPNDWKIKKIKDVCSMKSGLGITSEKISEFEDIPCYGGGGLRGYTKTFTHNGRHILIGRQGALCGNISFVQGCFYASEHSIVVTENSNTDIKWLTYSLYRMNLNQYTESSAQPGLSVLKILELPLITPGTIAEQTAIATALSDADALISSLEKLIEKKRNIKQGAMQQLLKPRKGWVTKRVEEISQVGRGRVISHREIGLSFQNTYPVYSSQTSNDGIMGYIDTFDFDGEYVTWTTDGENAGTVFYRNGKFNCTNVCGTIKIKSDNARFVAYFLNSVTSMYVSKNLANPKLMNDPMKKIEIALPSKEEQDRIANVIMDLENELKSLEKKLSKAQMLKQGMMQELLTGKIRLV